MVSVAKWPELHEWLEWSEELEWPDEFEWPDELKWSEDGEQVVFYLRGREAWTIIICNTEYRRMVEFCRRKASLCAMLLCFRSTYPRWRG